MHERGGWPEADLLQAADSLSFIETLTPLLREWIATGRSTREGALAKLDFMWDRMQVPRARELGRRDLRARARGGLVTRWLWPETLDGGARAARVELGDDALPIAGGTFVGVLAARRASSSSAGTCSRSVAWPASPTSRARATAW